MTVPYSLLLEQIRDRPFAIQPLVEPVPISALPTPALLLDDAALARNLSKMATFLEGKNKGFQKRCHFKGSNTHW